MNKYLSVSRVFAAGLIITPLIVSPFVLDFTLTARFISLSVCILTALVLIYRTRVPVKFDTDLPVILYAGFVGFSALSILWANTLSEAIFDTSKLFLGFSVFLLCLFVLKNDLLFFNRLMLFLPPFILFISLLVAGIQMSELKNFSKDSIYSVTGINGHKNLYSSFVFLNLFFLARNVFHSSKTWKVVSAISILISLLLLAILRTKAVWIGCSVCLLLATSLYFLRNKRFPKVNYVVILVITVILANVFFLFVLPPIIQKTINANSEIIKQKPELRQNKELDNERLVLWDKTYGVFRKHRLAGVGMGNWQIDFPGETLTGLWRAEDLNFTFQRPHNDLLWILSETGLIGFNLYLLFLLLLLILIFKAINYFKTNTIAQTDLILCFAFICGYTVISFFDFPKERIEHVCWSNLIFAIAYFHIHNSSVIKPGKPIHLKKLLPLAILLFLFITLTGIFRYRGEYYTRKLYDQRNQNNYSGVIKFADKASSFVYTMDPTSIPLSWFSGNARASLGDYVNAQNDFEKAYRLNPYNRNVVNDLASSYAYTGNRELAKKLYRETARISPRFDEARLNLVALLLQEQKYKEASACLDSIYHDSERRSQYRKMTEAFLNQH